MTKNALRAFVVALCGSLLVNSAAVAPANAGAHRSAAKAKIAMQSSGAGAGKVTFNPFSITRK
jgi:hypothetical protein